MDVLKDETGGKVRPREFDRTARDLVVNGFCSPDAIESAL